MNTDELKKLAERCIYHPLSSSVREVENAGEAIKELLAINAELVEALKRAIPHINPKAIDGDMAQNHPMEDCYINTIAMAALEKTEGGEL